VAIGILRAWKTKGVHVGCPRLPENQIAMGLLSPLSNHATVVNLTHIVGIDSNCLTIPFAVLPLALFTHNLTRNQLKGFNHLLVPSTTLAP
jgi:hypothetical protein